MKRAIFILLCLAAAAGFAVAPYLIFRVAEPENTMGFVQKIFYFHVPCAWMMLIAAIVAGVGGGAYLFGRRPWGDDLVAAASELVVLFGALVLITGPLWARVAWGHYWVWDARLTTMLLIFLIFLAVVLARRYAGSGARRVAAGLALFGAVDVPLIYASVRLWKTIHPNNTVVTSLEPGMRVALYTSALTFLALFVVLLWIRLGLERSRRQADALAVTLAELQARS